VNAIRELLDLLAWNDLFDIAVVAILLYNLLLLIRGTRAVQMLLGLLVVVGVYQIAKLAELRTLEQIIQYFFLFLPFAIIVLFQEPIRRALAGFGRTPVFGGSGRSRVETVVHEIASAAGALAKRRIGALIVIEGHEGLRNYVENGVALDAVVSDELLVSLFSPGTPLHDGAVVLRFDRVAAASCFLPLTSDSELAVSLGSRHRAALGISEETDALAIVVSEETGRISSAISGRLSRDLDTESLRALLRRHLLSEPTDTVRHATGDEAPA